MRSVVFVDVHLQRLGCLQVLVADGAFVAVKGTSFGQFM
jgi:hypothetical protein